MLKARGHMLLTKADEAKIEQASAEIEEMIQKEEQYAVRPSFAYITFQTLDGYVLAKKEFTPEQHLQPASLVNSALNKNYKNLRLIKISSPHATLYENLDATRKQRWIMGMIFVLILLAYLGLCIAAAYFSKAELLSIRYNYFWSVQCSAIDEMFGSNTDIYETWATYDSNFVRHG
jgi:hypothetical protein